LFLIKLSLSLSLSPPLRLSFYFCFLFPVALSPAFTNIDTISPKFLVVLIAEEGVWREVAEEVGVGLADELFELKKAPKPPCDPFFIVQVYKRRTFGLNWMVAGKGCSTDALAASNADWYQCRGETGLGPYDDPRPDRRSPACIRLWGLRVVTSSGTLTLQSPKSAGTSCYALRAL